MQSTRCLFSPARALSRVFLSHLDSTPITPTPFRNYPSYLSPRLFTTTSQAQFMKGRKANKPQKKQHGFPNDHAIPYKWVRVAQADESLSDPQRRADVLSKLDLSKYTLQMVALPPPPKEPSAEEQQEQQPDFFGLGNQQAPAAPICKIVDKYAQQKRQAELAKAARRKEVSRKELELNWAIAGHDLTYKMRQLNQWLEKGMKVEVMLAKKRHGRTASKDEAKTLLENLRAAVEGVGGKETKSEGEFPGVCKLIFEGKNFKG